MPLVRFIVKEDGETSVVNLALASDRRDVIVREAAITVAQMLMDAVRSGSCPSELSVTVELPDDQSIVASAALSLNIRGIGAA